MFVSVFCGGGIYHAHTDSHVISLRVLMKYSLYLYLSSYHYPHRVFGKVNVA